MGAMPARPRAAPLPSQSDSPRSSPPFHPVSSSLPTSLPDLTHHSVAFDVTHLEVTPSDLPPLVVHPQEGQVGGCLQNHLQAWKDIGAGDEILTVLEKGYIPEFPGDQPPLTTNWLPYESATSPLLREVLGDQVQTLLEKEAIELVRKTQSMGFYSHVFLVRKKSGKMRPVVNLRALNAFLKVSKFKMETARSIASAVLPFDWATSLDLTDGYFHCPIGKSFRKYLRFVVSGKVYQFRALPFGLATAPSVFTLLLRPLAIFMHLQGHTLHRYLDDLLPRSQCRVTVHKSTQFLLDVLFRLGWRVNEEKSMLIPSQDFVYVGIRFQTLRGVMVPPEDRIEKISLAAVPLFQGPVSARYLLSFLGLVGSAEAQVPLGRLHIRPIQVCLRTQFHMGVHSLSYLVSVVGHLDAIQAIQWWCYRENLMRGMPLGPFVQNRTLYTDASMSHWGAHSEDHDFQVSGTWSQAETHYSINQLELLTVVRALGRSPPSWSDQKILIATDNSTVVSYINCQGGTKSSQLLNITWQLFDVAQDKRLVLRARHIPGRLNRMADLLSRPGAIVATEWTLCPSVVTSIWNVWGRASVDLMATFLTARLPRFISPYPHPKAIAVDAMSCQWAGMEGYMFPPWQMYGPVLTKLVSETDCTLTLVVPKWPNRPWFPLLLQMICDFPRQLPLKYDLLKMPISGQPHGALSMLNLHVCRLSSRLQKSKAFRERCCRDWPTATRETLPPNSTIVDGTLGIFGVFNGISIPALPL